MDKNQIFKLILKQPLELIRFDNRNKLMKIYHSHFLLGLLFIFVFSSFSILNIEAIEPDLPNSKKKIRSKSIKICVISDLNSSYGSTNYADEVKSVIGKLNEIKPDLILCAGDMVAGQKTTLTEDNIISMWSSFKSSVLNPISSLKIPFGFTLGNHDASPSYLLDRKLSQRFWVDNKVASNLDFVDSSNYPFYYSYVKDRVYFISWDAASAKINPDVYQWMEEQLSTKQAQKAKLRILIGHLPLYAIVDSKNKVGEVNEDPEKALNFFKKHGINLYISGHQHAFYPAIKEGIRFLNAGCIGDGPRKLIANNAEAVKTYTIINIPKRKALNFTYKTYDAKHNLEIDVKSLPDSVAGFNGISIKDIK
jgi:predicted phosphodiesterase